MTSDETSGEDKESRIRYRAYMLWLAEGQPDGRDQEHWHLASEEAVEDADPPATMSQGSGKPASRSTSAGT